ncbi:TolC family protein [Spirobacillus cienkowskii]
MGAFMNLGYRVLKFSILALGFLVNTLLAAQQKIGFLEFINLYETNSLGVKSIKANLQSLDLEHAQAELLTQPQGFVEFSKNNDKSPSLTPDFSGLSRYGSQFRVGLQSQQSFGLKHKLYFITENQGFERAVSLSEQNKNMTRLGVAVELELPIWKNGFGENLKYQKESLLKLAKSQELKNQFELLAKKIDAEKIYIEYAYLQSSMEIQKLLVDQGERLLAWVKRQYKDRLLEEVHVAQAEAALESRKLGMLSKELKQKNILLKLKSLLPEYIEKNFIAENIDEIEKYLFLKNITEERKDILALQESIFAETANIYLQKESLKPELNFNFQFISYKKIHNTDNLTNCQGLTNCSLIGATLSFVVPLDFSTVQLAQNAAQDRIHSLKLNLSQEILNSKSEFEILRQQNDSLDKQILSLKDLIKIHENRLEFERARQRRGRATTFDLINSEQDLSESKDRLVEAKSARLAVLSQYKLYEVLP